MGAACPGIVVSWVSLNSCHLVGSSPAGNLVLRAMASSQASKSGNPLLLHAAKHDCAKGSPSQNLHFPPPKPPSSEEGFGGQMGQEQVGQVDQVGQVGLAARYSSRFFTVTKDAAGDHSKERSPCTQCGHISTGSANHRTLRVCCHFHCAILRLWHNSRGADVPGFAVPEKP